MTVNSADLVVRNFVWRIEAITPTCTTLDEAFHEVDPLAIEPQQAAGLTRAFWVEWLRSDAEHSVDGNTICDDGAIRWATHHIRVTVRYAVKLTNALMHDVVLQDRHDLLEALRSQANRVGYDASHTATDIGLGDRYRTSDSIERDPGADRSAGWGYWSYVSDWKCVISESEI